MYLRPLMERNRAFVEAAVVLHQDKQIPANSYVLDLDTMQKNASILKSRADSLGLKIFAMSKQFGRNPAAFNAIARGGITEYVAVDMACARPVHKAGYRVGHIGHLVQVPRDEALAAAAMKPRYWTIFSREKAQEAAAAATSIGVDVSFLARIFAKGDTFYMGHEGGFPAEEILKTAEYLDQLAGGSFAGITTFPALLFNQEEQAVKPTPNLKTLERAANQLAAAGRKDLEINAPGTTSSTVMDILANAGATQVEPGHGLTGSTPLHAVKDLPEEPAILYLSEVAHTYQGRPYCFGGGFYIDPVFPDYQVQALVGADPVSALKNKINATIPPPSAIDYYGILEPDINEPVRTGDTVIFGFRAQVFVTRAYVVPVSGIRSGKPTVEGVWSVDGRKIDWPSW